MSFPLAHLNGKVLQVGELGHPLGPDALVHQLRIHLLLLLELQLQLLPAALLEQAGHHAEIRPRHGQGAIETERLFARPVAFASPFGPGAVIGRPAGGGFDDGGRIGEIGAGPFRRRRLDGGALLVEDDLAVGANFHLSRVGQKLIAAQW